MRQRGQRRVTELSRKHEVIQGKLRCGCLCDLYDQRLGARQSTWAFDAKAGDSWPTRRELSFRLLHTPLGVLLFRSFTLERRPKALYKAEVRVTLQEKSA